MSALEDKVSNLESLFLKRQEEKKKKSFNKLFRRCVFCTGNYEECSTSFGEIRAADLIADEIIRQAYQIEQGKEFPKVNDSSECKLHDDPWLVEHSSLASGFITMALKENDVVDIDPYNPKTVITLLTDFDTMDFVFHRWRHKRTQQFEIDRSIGIGYGDLDNIDHYFEFACKSLRTVGKKWIASLDPEKFGPRHLRLVEQYGPNFGRGGVFPTKEIRERKKKEFESWLDKAEKELGKGLVQNSIRQNV